MRLVRLAVKSNFSFVTSVRPYGTTHEITGVMGHRIPVNCLLANILQLFEKTQNFSHNRTKISHAAKKALRGLLYNLAKLIIERERFRTNFVPRTKTNFRSATFFMEIVTFMR